MERSVALQRYRKHLVTQRNSSLIVLLLGRPEATLWKKKMSRSEKKKVESVSVRVSDSSPRQGGNRVDGELVLLCCWECNTAAVQNEKRRTKIILCFVLLCLCVLDTTTTCSPTLSRPACWLWWTAWLIVRTSWWTSWFQLLPSNHQSKSHRRSSTKKRWWARWDRLVTVMLTDTLVSCGPTYSEDW